MKKNLQICSSSGFIHRDHNKVIYFSVNRKTDLFDCGFTTQILSPKTKQKNKSLKSYFPMKPVLIRKTDPWITQGKDSICGGKLFLIPQHPIVFQKEWPFPWKIFKDIWRPILGLQSSKDGLYACKEPLFYP